MSWRDNDEGNTYVRAARDRIRVRHLLYADYLLLNMFGEETMSRFPGCPDWVRVFAYLGAPGLISFFSYFPELCPIGRGLPVSDADIRLVYREIIHQVAGRPAGHWVLGGPNYNSELDFDSQQSQRSFHVLVRLMQYWVCPSNSPNADVLHELSYENWADGYYGDRYPDTLLPSLPHFGAWHPQIGPPLSALSRYRIRPVALGNPLGFGVLRSQGYYPWSYGPPHRPRTPEVDAGALVAAEDATALGVPVYQGRPIAWPFGPSAPTSLAPNAVDVYRVLSHFTGDEDYRFDALMRDLCHPQALPNLRDRTRRREARAAKFSHDCFLQYCVAEYQLPLGFGTSWADPPCAPCHGCGANTRTYCHQCAEMGYWYTSETGDVHLGSPLCSKCSTSCPVCLGLVASHGSWETLPPQYTSQPDSHSMGTIASAPVEPSRDPAAFVRVDGSVYYPNPYLRADDDPRDRVGPAGPGTPPGTPPSSETSSEDPYDGGLFFRTSF